MARARWLGPWRHGEGLGGAIEIGGEAKNGGCLVDPFGNLGFGHLCHLEGEAHVAADRHVRVQGVVLEDHGDVTLTWRQVVDGSLPDVERSIGDLLEAGDHAECSGLSTAGRADEHHELSIGDFKVEATDGNRTVLVFFTNVVERNLSHATHDSTRCVALDTPGQTEG
jgi:hypothetical protein